MSLDTLNHKTLQRWRRDPIAFIEEVFAHPETQGVRLVLLDAERAFLHARLPDRCRRYACSTPSRFTPPPRISGKSTFAALRTRSRTDPAVRRRLSRGYGRRQRFRAGNRVALFEMLRRTVECSPLLQRRGEGSRLTGLRSPPCPQPSRPSHAATRRASRWQPRTSPCFDELWAYTSERSRRLWDELVPPPTRKVACLSDR